MLCSGRFSVLDTISKLGVCDFLVPSFWRRDILARRRFGAAVMVAIYFFRPNITSTIASDDSHRICTPPPPFLIFFLQKMTFHKYILSKFFVYDENLPSSDFWKIEKTPKIFYLPNNDKSIGIFCFEPTLHGTDLNPNRNRS